MTTTRADETLERIADARRKVDLLFSTSRLFPEITHLCNVHLMSWAYKITFLLRFSEISCI